MGVVKETLRALAAGSITLDQAVDRFGRVDWQPQRRTEDGHDPEPVTVDSWEEVYGAYLVDDITGEQYEALWAACSDQARAERSSADPETDRVWRPTDCDG